MGIFLSPGSQVYSVPSAIFRTNALPIPLDATLIIIPTYRFMII
jgi:hypothetical protein